MLFARHLGSACRLLTTALLTAATAGTAAEDKTVLHPDAQGYVRDWILGNPYPAYLTSAGESTGYDRDALAHLGGELNFEPYPGMEEKILFKITRADNIAVDARNEWGYTSDKTFTAKWQVKSGATSPVMAFENPVKHHVTGYAACYVISDAERPVKMRIGCADDYKLFINHRFIGGFKSNRSFQTDAYLHPVTLEKGVNLVMLKLVDHGNGHSFSLSVRSADESPCPGLEIRLENPKAKLLAEYRELTRIDGYAGNFFGAIDVAPDNPLMPGELQATFRLGAVAPGTAAIRLTATAADGGRRLDEKLEGTFENGKLLTFNRCLTCKTPGPLTVAAEITRDNGQTAVSRRFDLHSPEQITRNADETRVTLKARQREAEALAADLQKEDRNYQQLRAETDRQYQTIERLHEEKHRQLQTLSGPAGRSIDEPFSPPEEAPRAEMLLNGDNWEFAPGRQTGTRYFGDAGGFIMDYDTEQIPTSGWSATRVPLLYIKGDYWGMNYHFPVRCKAADGPPVTQQPYGGDYQYSPTRLNNGIWHRLHFDLPAGWEKQHLRLTLRNTQAWARVFLNGVYCGEESGFTGDYLIPLKNARPGRNELVVFIGSGRTKFCAATPCDDRWYPFWGICGDVILETLPAVAADELWVKTSVREATITVRLSLDNRSRQTQTITVENYCVLNGKIRKRLPPQTLKLAPGATAIDFEVSASWTDAELWGIGGPYGKPVLYRLVTELRDNGRLLDRTYTRFGFREFWVEGCHFYLNGKRIFLQGDIGTHSSSNRHILLTLLPLLREYGINVIRNHDDELNAPELPEICDELGMLVIAQNYPFVDPWPMPRHNGYKFMPFANLPTSPIHKINQDNYTRWVKMMRNHPSVVIYSIDNEMFLQNWEKNAKKFDYAMRNDRVGAFYGDFVKKLDPTRVITRDGDQGTWGPPLGCWSQDPPCDTANYHYPEADINATIRNWQTIYGGRPVLFGETLYCSYASLNDWCGPTPEAVNQKAQLVRDVAGLYRDHDIPGAVFMGLSSDGFVESGPTGNYPWKNAKPEDVKRHPYPPVAWPSLSGPGRKEEFAFTAGCYGYLNINWFDPAYPAATPNAVNAAYKAALRPMPELNRNKPPELLAIVTRNGKPVPAVNVTVSPAGNQATSPKLILTDAQGTAWFRLDESGPYTVECGGVTARVETTPTNTYPVKPGFGHLQHLHLELR